MNAGRIVGGLALALHFLLFSSVPAHAQGVVFASSDSVVTIHSTFTGQAITLFGNIEQAQDSGSSANPYDVVVVVRGPASDRVVRQKQRQFGLILNTGHAAYEKLPGFYSVLMSRPLEAISRSKAQLDDPSFAISDLVASSRTEGGDEYFDRELIRLMSEADLFHSDERGVSFLSPTVFSTRIHLPSHIPNGLFIAKVFVISDGDVVSTATTSFTVRTEGFERFVSRAAQNNPLAYGLVAVFMALVTGWLGGILFKR